MQQLSGADTNFLTLEQGNNYSHVGALALYDPATAPNGKVRFKDILAHFDVRMRENPFFRRRLIEPPLNIDRPYWIDTADFDVEFHVRHIALPEPGDWRQLMIQVARLHARPLDRNRPLWEIYVIGGLDNIPGLPNGCFALFYKMHHAAVDGMAGLHIISEMHTQVPELVTCTENPKPTVIDREPGLAEIGSRAIVNQGKRNIALSGLAANSAVKLAKATSNIVFGAQPFGEMISELSPAPETRFGVKVSPHRTVEGIGLPLDSFIAIRRKVKGVTINDIFVAVVSGAMRRYLLEHDELPEKSLATLMPVSLRAHASAGGNDVGVATMSLHTDVEGPIARLKACHSSASSQKNNEGALSQELPVLIENLPPSMTSWLFQRMVGSMNTVVSNVRGPDQSQFLAGAELQRIYPISITSDYIGINHTAISYGGFMWLGVVACRDVLPDPDFYAECVRSSFNELLTALKLKPVSGPAFENGAKE